MKVLINYSDGNFSQAQLRNTTTGIATGNFDKAFAYGPRDIGAEFYTQNRGILTEKRGAGYWLWKPYLILRTLHRLQAGDWLFYCDAGAEFIDSIDPLIELCEANDQDVMVFEMEHIEKHWTKRDAFILMDCDCPEYAETKQRLAAFILCRHRAFTFEFMSQYLGYARDERVITDIENQMGHANYEGFIEHRHDQSILSLLSKKYRLRAYRDPSQWGNAVISNYPESRYGQLINHTRARNAPGFMVRMTNKTKRLAKWILQGR